MTILKQRKRSRQLPPSLYVLILYNLLPRGRFRNPQAKGRQKRSRGSFTHQRSTLGISPVQVLSSRKYVMNVTDHDLLRGSPHLIDFFLCNSC